MERCFWLWQQISFLLPSCSETRLWSASRTSWLLQKSFSSCLSWWICWRHILSPVPLAALWCTVSFSFYLGEKSPRHVGGQQHLERITNRVITDGLTSCLFMLQPKPSQQSTNNFFLSRWFESLCFLHFCAIRILFREGKTSLSKQITTNCNVHFYLPNYNCVLHATGHAYLLMQISTDDRLGSDLWNSTFDFPIH